LAGILPHYRKKSFILKGKRWDRPPRLSLIRAYRAGFVETKKNGFNASLWSSATLKGLI
jgi:hypothetical protein